MYEIGSQTRTQQTNVVAVVRYKLVLSQIDGVQRSPQTVGTVPPLTEPASAHSPARYSLELHLVPNLISKIPSSPSPHSRHRLPHSSLHLRLRFQALL